MKFLSINNNLALIRYLSLVNNIRVKKISEKDNKDNKENIDNRFIEKYLINTWILELLLGKNENEISKELDQNLRAFIRTNRQYLDLSLLYYILNVYGKEKELLELASNKLDYETYILYLINKRKFLESINDINGIFAYGIEEVNVVLKKLFFNYSKLFMKEYPKETIQVLKQCFQEEYKPEDILKILISPNYHILSRNSENFKEVIEYVKKLKKEVFKQGDRVLNLKKNQNLHNLYILLLAYSKEDTYKNELIEYLKSPIKAYEIKEKFKSEDIKISGDIYFDLYFAKKIFEEKNEEKDIKALCLVLHLLGQYSDSIDIILKNKFTDLIPLLPKNIPDYKLKKKMWLKIFKSKKDDGNLSEAKKIIAESDGIIKIEDVLPLMGDNVKISEFKDELKKCIEKYEENVRILNKEINEFNESNDSINKDINSSEKKAIKMSYTKLKCTRCSNFIKGPKFFMFPCGHIFDVICLIETYFEFEKNKLGDKKFKDKVKVIRELQRKIIKLREKKQKSLEGEIKSKEENDGTLNKLKNIKTYLMKELNKIIFSKEEDLMLKDTEKILYDYLDEECLLCGKEMINSTQIDFGDEDDFEWKLN